jgi:hypothetical protein
MKPRGRLVHVEELNSGQRDQMFALMDRHYRNMVRARFEEDLAEKQWVILVLDDQELCGFSTQVLLSADAAGRPIRVLFSGDTIIDRQHWGDPALAHIWGRLALSLIDAYPHDALYWFLISKGYKTYRYLPLFFREFYPRPDMSTPAWASEVIDCLGRTRFPESYDARRGIVRAQNSKDYLREGIAPVTPQRLRDPFVGFFVERNPGHVHGEELCCIAPLTRENFTPAAYRVIGPEPALAATCP